MRSALHVRIVWHRCVGEIELRIGLDLPEECRRGQEDRTFARGEAALAGVGTTGIIVGLVLLQIDQSLKVLHLQWSVEFERGVEAIKAIGLGRERYILPGRQLLKIDPGDPGVGKAAGRVTGGLQFLGVLEHLRPGLWNLGNVGLLQRILVDPHDSRRRVEGERQHLALGGRVVTGDGGQIGLWVELLAGVGHQLVNRLHRAGRCHHGCGPDFEHLQEMRRVAGAKRGDACVHRVGIAALVGWQHLVIGLRGVEFLGQLDDHVIIRASHRMPPLNLSHRVSGRGGERKRDSNCRGRAEFSKSHQIPPVGPSSSLRALTAPDDVQMTV